LTGNVSACASRPIFLPRKTQSAQRSAGEPTRKHAPTAPSTGRSFRTPTDRRLRQTTLCEKVLLTVRHRGFLCCRRLHYLAGLALRSRSFYASAVGGVNGRTPVELAEQNRKLLAHHVPIVSIRIQGVQPFSFSGFWAVLGKFFPRPPA